MSLERVSQQKLILFSIAAFLISLKADGRFPLPATLSESTFQLMLLPYTILFIVVVMLFFKRNRLKIIPGLIFEKLGGKNDSPSRLAACISIAFVTMTLLIFLWQEKKYFEFGYRVNRPVLFSLYAFSLTLLLLSLLRNQKPERFLFATVAIFACTCTFSIFSFPLHPARSDMLPLIQAAGKQFLAGGNPYSVYSLPHEVPLTYLPGMWLAYLPAVAMNFDPRFIHAASVLISVLILYTATPPGKKEIAAALCGLFLLIPYLLYRHEIYLGVLWLSFSLVYYFEMKNKPIWSAFWMGIAATTSQFAWVLIPMVLFNLYRRSGFKVAFLSLICCAAVFSAVILLFVIRTPEGFYHGVFAHWGNTFNATTMNLSYFVKEFFSVGSLKFFQIVAVGFVYWLALRNANRVYEMMTYALLLFILFNPLIWVYFYLTLFPIMIMDAGNPNVGTPSIS